MFKISNKQKKTTHKNCEKKNCKGILLIFFCSLVIFSPLSFSQGKGVEEGGDEGGDEEKKLYCCVLFETISPL